MICLCTVIILIVLYKLLDRLVRIPMIGGYNDRYILVTGCDSGFGNLLARRLDERGCHVFASCFTEKGETELKKASSDRLHAFYLDVSKPESVHKAFDFVKSKLPSGRSLWGVMNNAGLLNKMGPAEWASIDDYRLMNSVNVLGLIDVTMTFLPLIKAEHGRIVCTSSVFGRHSISDAVPYCVSKFGVEAFVDGLRRSLKAFGCKAILVEPGIHNTPMATPDSLTGYYKRAWDEATPEIKEEYGEDYYSYVSVKGVEKLLAVASKKPSDVVDAYEHALLGRYPRARYVVGKDANYIWLPIQALPEWIGDWILSKFDPERPLPKAVRNQ